MLKLIFLTTIFFQIEAEKQNDCQNKPGCRKKCSAQNKTPICFAQKCICIPRDRPSTGMKSQAYQNTRAPRFGFGGLYGRQQGRNQGRYPNGPPHRHGLANWHWQGHWHWQWRWP